MGVGEATTLLTLANNLENKNEYYGFDISWSRIKYAENFALNYPEISVKFFIADLFSIPLKDDSIDVVYTCHSIEPNGGKEESILKELYRISGKYLILLEPAYELANSNDLNPTGIMIKKKIMEIMIIVSLKIMCSNAQ